MEAGKVGLYLDYAFDIPSRVSKISFHQPFRPAASAK